MPSESITNNPYAPKMRIAIARLRKEKIYFKVMTAYHIKCGDLNFYPGRGTIHRDGDRKALPGFGLETFVSLFRREEEAESNLLILDMPQ